MKIRQGFAMIVLGLVVSACAPATKYSVEPVNGKYVDNAELMRRNPTERLSESAAIDKQKQQSAPARELDSRPVILQSDLPSYPKDVKKERIEGVVEIRFTVNDKGYVSDPTIVSSPDPRLSAVCLDALSKWRFKPAIKNGAAVSVAAIQQFPFKLD